MAKAAVMGYGTVGSGVVTVLNTNADIIAKKAGEPIEVKYILDIRKFPGDPMEDRIIDAFTVIENDPEISVVAEVMGGTGVAYEFTKRALKAGKSVDCTDVCNSAAGQIALARPLVGRHRQLHAPVVW